jgi:hypothetical protein
MKTKEMLKLEFELFFEKHPSIRQIPFLMNIVIPKYESKGDRVIMSCGELLETDEYNEYVDADYTDIESFWESFMYDIPYISKKDAFYIFDENTMVLVSNKDGVDFITYDFTNEIWDMY